VKLVYFIFSYRLCLKGGNSKVYKLISHYSFVFKFLNRVATQPAWETSEKGLAWFNFLLELKTIHRKYKKSFFFIQKVGFKNRQVHDKQLSFFIWKKINHWSLASELFLFYWPENLPTWQHCSSSGTLFRNLPLCLSG
jgi:hypothetical protein